jgi:hypothetical protein
MSIGVSSGDQTNQKKNTMETEKAGSKKSGNYISQGKDLVALLRDASILLIMLLLLFLPTKINDLLVKAGFEEGSFVGIKWKAGLAQSDLSLKEAQATITSLRTQLDSLTAVLQQAQESINDPALTKKITQINKDTRALTNSSLQMQTSVQRTISSNATMVKSAQQVVNGGTGWGVVFSADVTLEAAKYEIDRRAPRAGISGAEIFYRQRSYRSVKILNDRDQAEALLRTAKALYPDAYIVPMNTWCSDAEEKEGYRLCKGK